MYMLILNVLCLDALGINIVLNRGKSVVHVARFCFSQVVWVHAGVHVQYSISERER